MKTFLSFRKSLFPGFFLLLAVASFAQVTYTYRLSSDFRSDPVSPNDLVQIPNNSGDKGTFLQRPVPASTCGQQGTASGYFFHDDAGLQFNNPEGFIGNSYSIAFNFQMDEFITPPPWVRIMSFTHTDDHGIYIYLSNPPGQGTLEFWPNGTVGPDDFFTTVDFYQMILIREESGLIRIYVNGNEFDTYDDSGTQEYLPQAGKNYIIWFRDDPSVLADEASPGFVQNIIIANYAWSADKVQEIWQRFCSSLLGTGDAEFSDISVFPNPARDRLYIRQANTGERCVATLYDITGLERGSQSFSGPSLRSFDLSGFPSGIYFIRIISGERSRVFRFVKN